MPPPSRLKIATNAVTRLLNEQAAYHDEMKDQQRRVLLAESEQDADPENGEFMVLQQRKALAETEAVIQPLRQRIELAVAQLQQQLSEEEDPAAAAEEVRKAEEALERARKVQFESAT